MSRVRDHWSIGEVLALLQDEFPEVTISKIRFLESQGLIDPERTPSGYRKFSDTDYDRLYWILEQQRDHYLPLRVIRDRLEEGQDIGAAPRRSDLRIGDQIEGADEDSEESDAASAREAQSPQAGEGYGAAHDPEAGLDESFADALAGVAGRVAASGRATHPVRDESSNALAEVMGAREETGAVGVGQDHAQNDAETSQGSSAEEATFAVDTSSLDEPEAPTTEVPTTEAVADDVPEVEMTKSSADESSSDEEDGVDQVTKKPAPRLLGTRSEAPLPIIKTTAEALAPPIRPSLPGSSVALTGAELAEQSGTTPGMIAELQKYGMISPRQVGGTVLFDSTALTIARLAVQFGRYGLEPRHLKTFRLGAEREVALLTQSIGPTLKANNPETRRRSYDTLQDLAELSASLRSIIVRDLVADLEPGG
jgi:DNA-binding transcriptional MerR regulator